MFSRSLRVTLENDRHKISKIVKSDIHRFLVSKYIGKMIYWLFSAWLTVEVFGLRWLKTVSSTFRATLNFQNSMAALNPMYRFFKKTLPKVASYHLISCFTVPFLNYKPLAYHRFRGYATLENKTPAETFPKFPSVLRVIDRSDQNPPITAR